ncbi:MAG TPA: hypothetical protein VG101_15825 [Puia sp.]|nr:hypothetical protein [Puia sp.]
MYTPSARRGTILLVVILLLISILLEQAIAGICPWLSQVGGVRPMIVFLDIPLEAPMTIDWLPVGFIFIIFYSIVRPRNEEAGDPTGNVNGSGTFGRGWAILGRWWLLLILMLTGGGIYYGLSGFLPKEIRNGIESFGMRADLTLPYPSGETVHLQGSMIMLAFFIFGWRLLINKAIPPAAVQPAREPVVATAAARSSVKKSLNPGPAPAPARPIVTVAKPIIATPPPPPIPAETALPNRGRIAMRIPEPVEVKGPAGRPCIYVAMPAGFQRKRTSYPCVVEDGIRPSGIRQKEMMQ